MALKLFNTLSRSTQDFVPLDSAGKKVGMYCCGPTVYDAAHIGNWRTFVFCDLVRRFLEFKGYHVTHVMNITDVEDKIIKGVRETGTPLSDYTATHEAAFIEDSNRLNCRLPHHTPHATAHIADILALIERLLQRGLAYKAADGSIYFSIEKYRAQGGAYGQLVKLNFDEMRPGQRVNTDDYAKEAVADFALWKARVPEDGGVFWPSPWGDGRPGWHIECSAMSMKLLGPSFDLHLGGEDLMFPHHEDEIAQSEGAGVQPSGQRFVKYWLHGAHLLVEGRKMSKSLGNFFTVRDLLSKGFTGREIRYLLLTAHYRETFNFTLEGLHGAGTALARIEECLKKLIEIGEATGGDTHATPDRPIVEQFTAALDDDLNMSRAWGVVFEWVRELNRAISQGALPADRANAAVATWKRLDEVLGLNFTLQSDKRLVESAPGNPPAAAPGANRSGESDVPNDVLDLARQRMEAKKAKNFKLADGIREKIKSLGYQVEDTPKGPKLKKL
jgi:cysteinyl-tRNA synthetase